MQSLTRDLSGAVLAQCAGCGQRLTGERGCRDCNLYARRVGTGGACRGCGEILTIDELLEGTLD